MARTQTVMAANVAQRANQLVKEQTRLIEAQDLGAVRLANLETAFAKFEVTLSSIQAQNDLAFKAKQKEDAAKLKALKEQAAGKGSSTLRAAPTNDALERRRSAPRVQPVIALTRSALPSCGSTSPRSRDRRIRRGHEEERKEVTRFEGCEGRRRSSGGVRAVVHADAPRLLSATTARLVIPRAATRARPG